MSFVEFPTPTPNSAPGSIAVGSDGNLWFTKSAYGLNQIGRITPTGAITEFPVSGGNVWVAMNGYMAIGRVTPAGR